MNPDRDYPPSEEPALIGVSGGRDSVALLHLLATRGHRLIVCHLDHALRAESREEERFVEATAVRLRCEFVVLDRALAQVRNADFQRWLWIAGSREDARPGLIPYDGNVPFAFSTSPARYSDPVMRIRGGVS